MVMQSLWMIGRTELTGCVVVGMVFVLYNEVVVFWCWFLIFDCLLFCLVAGYAFWGFPKPRGLAHLKHNPIK
jgi:hypothetical protein